MRRMYSEEEVKKLIEEHAPQTCAHSVELVGTDTGSNDEDFQITLKFFSTSTDLLDLGQALLNMTNGLAKVGIYNDNFMMCFAVNSLGDEGEIDLDGVIYEEGEATQYNLIGTLTKYVYTIYDSKGNRIKQETITFE